jgi:hypothetical protein
MVWRTPTPHNEHGAGGPGGHKDHPDSNGEFHMSKKIMSTAILAGLLFGLAAPIAQAKDAPKTKAECEKMTNMKWDDATSKCVKK